MAGLFVFYIFSVSDILQEFDVLSERPYVLKKNEDYSKIIKKYADVIGKEFELNIQEEIWDYENKTIEFSFSVDGVSEKLLLQIDGNRIDKEFTNKLKAILKSLKLRKKLVTIGAQTKTYGLGYFNEKQIKWLKTNEGNIWISEF